MWFKVHWPVYLVWAGLIYILLRLYISGRMVRFSDRAGDRSLHQGEVLTGGGFLLFVPIAAMMMWYQWYLPAVLVFILTVLGVIDDVRQLSARLRLIVQFLVVIAALWFVGVGFLWWGIFLCVAFVWWINLFNFMDGANGLVGLHALVTLATVLFIPESAQSFKPVVMSIMIALAVYLYFNMGLKRLFMGDSGSLPLAFILGFLALWMMQGQSLNALQVAVMHAVLITDSSLTLVMRLMRGEAITQAHRSHLYQRLIGPEGPHGPVSMVYAAVTGLCCTVAVMMSDLPLTRQWLWFVSVYLVLAVVFFQTRRLGR